MTKKSSIGIIGLGVMGANLARNIASKNFKTSVYNRNFDKTKNLIDTHGSENLVGFEGLEDFVGSLESPKKIGIMINSGKPVDEVILQLKPLLDSGDVIIDFGNSNHKDTLIRFKELEKVKINFVGCGVSGGEQGALDGPSIMPGGSKESWGALKPILEKIAAKDFSDKPTVTYVGPDAAGHYVKMVHNGIEYAVLQLMSEVYDFYRKACNLSAEKIAEIFKEYNNGQLQSYLFEIAVEVLNKKDEQGGGFLVDKILDKAGQKGTGSWMVVDALERGVSVPTAASAVFARIDSSQKERRIELGDLYVHKHDTKISIDEVKSVIEDAMYAGILSSYAQGFELMRVASKEYDWNLDFAEISRIWEGGCIIRAKLLNFLHTAFQGAGKNTPHLFEIPEIKKVIQNSVESWQQTVGLFASAQISAPAINSSLNYFIATTSGESPANLIQGLRDYFGAHTYERKDKEGSFHTDWN